jgi:hypothetical protein
MSITFQKASFFCAVALLLTGCAGTLQLLPRDGGQRAMGTFNTITKTLEANLSGKLYSGKYVTNAGSSFTTVNAYSGTQSAYGSGQTFSSGNSGAALLVAADGDTLRCEFNYQGLNAIGICKSREGRIFDLTTQ